MSAAAPVFSALVVTAPPPGLAGEAGGYQVKVDGREALLRSVELFLSRPDVPQVRVALDEAGADESRRRFGNHLSFSGVKVVWSTGRRADQLAAAADGLAADATHVVVHDAARPCVPFPDVDALLAAAAGGADAATLSAPVRAGVVELDDGGGPVAAHPAGRFAQLLTPYVLGRDTFLGTAAARQDVHPSAWTLVPGSPLNVRVGRPADAAVAKAMLALLPKPKAKGGLNPFEEAQW